MASRSRPARPPHVGIAFDQNQEIFFLLGQWSSLGQIQGEDFKTPYDTPRAAPGRDRQSACP